MKYCIPYYNSSQYKDVANEISILVTEKEELRAIPNFLKTRPETQRIIFRFRNLFSELTNIDYSLLSMSLAGYHYTICLDEIEPLYHNCAETFKKYKLNFYFNNPVYTYDELYGLCDIGVSDIIISGDLGFDKKAIQTVKSHFPNIIIRAYPDICQSKWQSLIIPLTFWIRPEDQDYYEEMIDVFDFWWARRGPEKADVIYKIYAIDKEWYGDLSRLIIGLQYDNENGKIDSRCFDKSWAENRVQCRRRCLQGSNCSICREAVKMAQNIRALGGVIKTEKPHSPAYNMIMETFEALDKEKGIKIEEQVQKVLGDFYEEYKDN